MDARDVCAVGDVLAEGLDGTTRQIQEVHEAIADRTLRLAGPARKPAQAVHDRLSGRAYALVRGIGPAALRAGSLALGMALDAESDRMNGSRHGRAVVSALNGVFGDALASRRNGLALRMSIRADGREVNVDAEALRQAFPDSRQRVAVFVHGFGETDDSWRWFATESWGTPAVSYGTLLRRDRGYTPVYVHYNTGRPIAQNAAELSALLEQLNEGWPVPLREVVLIGHSAGGLVARAAIRHGNLAGARWVRSATHVFTLGTPRHAITAEWLSLAIARALRRLPETRPLARLLDARSAGLKDLGENDTGPLPVWVTDVRLPKGSADDSGAARSGEPGRLAGRGPEAFRVGHFRLLNHPAIYAQITARLSDHSVPFPAQAARGGRYERAARALRAQRRSPRR
jgi:pimeloyl-ACP methyl ester carboxylesterase